MDRLALLTGVNIGLAIANVLIAIFNVRLFRGRPRRDDARHEHWGRE